MEVGKSEIIYLSLHCHHQNDSCIKMGSDESHFNLLLIVRDRMTPALRWVAMRTILFYFIIYIYYNTLCKLFW